MTFDVTLTFDNGPDIDVTPGVLDTLQSQGVKATFFVLGRKLADPACHALAERAVAEGHWIGNHTYSHKTPLGRLTEADVAETEIGRTQALLGRLSHPEKYFRPFGGGGAIGPHLLNAEALEYLEAGGFTCVLWNVIPRDWEFGESWPERAMELMAAKPWSLVVVHDTAGPQMQQLDRFIGMVRVAGGRFRQDFPPECVPLRMGHAVLPMEGYVARAS